MLKEYLKQYRLRKNLTQAQMSELLETSQSYYSRLERGHRKPGIQMINRISKLLNQSPEFIRSLL